MRNRVTSARRHRPRAEAVPTPASSRKPLRLLVEERRRRILELLDEQERVTVEELSARFHVSAVTIRGDLEALSASGALVRSHGGALRQLDQPDAPIAVKETLHHGEKVRIGHAAARLIRQDETIILDSGTTTVEIARQIKFLQLRSLTVITNALNIAMELANLPHVRVIMIGDACIGSSAEAHESALASVYRNFGDVRTSEEVIELLSAPRSTAKM